MEGSSSTANPPAKIASKGGGMVVAGYSIVAAGLVAFLTINGASNTPAFAVAGTAGLIAIGLLLPAAGLLLMGRGIGRIKSAARYGFGMQAVGLLGLLIGVVLIQVAPALSGYVVGAVLVGASGVAAVTGAALVQGQVVNHISSGEGHPAPLVAGTALIFSGVGVIMGSNIAFEYLISSVENTIYVDLGATISACGCVLAAYSFFALFSRL
jgi:hypothetical protein